MSLILLLSSGGDVLQPAGSLLGEREAPVRSIQSTGRHEASGHDVAPASHDVIPAPLRFPNTIPFPRAPTLSVTLRSGL